MVHPISEDTSTTVLRVGVMGAAACGKTSILNQYLKQVFVDWYFVTTGEVHEAEMNIEEKTTLLEIYDTSGGYCFDAARKGAIRICDAFILVYAVNSESSFDRIAELQNEILAAREDDVPIVVVATMTDLPTKLGFSCADEVPKDKEEEPDMGYQEDIVSSVECILSDKN